MLIDRCITNSLMYLSPRQRYLILFMLILRRGRLKLNEVVAECLRLGLKCKSIEKYLLELVNKGDIVFDGEKYVLNECLQHYANTLYDLIEDLRRLEEQVMLGNMDTAYVVSRILTIPAILITLASSEEVDEYSKSIYAFITILQLELFTTLSKVNKNFREMIKSIESALSSTD